tara:strand:- start:1293 stop:1667 length:375 start_codon:yes stop_codon:yes gene_type:complete
MKLIKRFLKEKKMYDDNNIFAKILRKEIPCQIVYEDEFSLFFNDINPQAKIHVLAIPKVPCIDFSDFVTKNNPEVISSFFLSVEKVVSKLGIRKTGFRIVSNSGSDGGQEVPHFHLHILGGEKV